MNFPMEYPIFQFFYWLVNTAGVGGAFALLAGSGSILGYTIVLRWITRTEPPDSDTFAFPTPALHGHKEEGESAY